MLNGVGYGGPSVKCQVSYSAAFKKNLSFPAVIM